MSEPVLEFWYEFASTYSYLSSQRITAAAREAGVKLIWKPFLLGPIFRAQGWTTSPFNIYPAKGRYMVRDISRIAAARGLPFVMPATFPANGLQAARLALAAGDSIGPFTEQVYRAQFSRGADIADAATLTACLEATGLDARALLERAGSDSIKAELRSNCERAGELGIFGAPSFVTADGELFWGDDRLDQALSWAVSPRYQA